MVVDISKNLPFEASSADMCLLATVIHDLSLENRETTLKEVNRVLKPGRTLLVIEFKKIEFGPGPPVNIRLSEDEITDLAFRHKLLKISGGEIGDFHYYIKFQKMT
jgi:ubiquinone/menaquinone biosynthesis C-methylase UbiE